MQKQRGNSHEHYLSVSLPLTRCHDEFASKPLRILGGKEGDNTGNVIRLASATERRLLDKRLFDVGADEAGTVCAFGFDDAGIYRVDTDLSKRPRLSFVRGVHYKSYFVGVREGNGSEDREEEAMSSDRIAPF